MKYCLIGEKLSHSYSQAIHRELKADYSLVEVKKDDLKRFVFKNDFDGYNVTIPYKSEIIPYLDDVSPLAKRLGAVNVVKNENGKKFGDNTDYFGFINTVEKSGVSVCGKNALVLGSGGASKTAVAALYDLGAESVKVVSRSGDINYENCYFERDVSVIINATPVGMFPNIDDCPIDLERFKGLELVFDLIYNPFRTKLLLNAAALGIKAVNGANMLVAQALKAREIWTGEKVTEENIQKYLRFLMDKTVSVALVGMPSSGKGTIGRALAERLDKPFVDTDALIEKKVGASCEDIITERGEGEFRRIESEIVRSLITAGGKVVATGGGAILSEENRRILKQTSLVVYIKRDISLLSVKGRPISKERGLEKLFSERAPKYEAASDNFIINDGSVAEAVERIAYLYENFGY